MKILCIFISVCIIGVIGHRDPRNHFMISKCCKTEDTAGATEFIDKMMNLADECRLELGIKTSVLKKTFFKKNCIILGQAESGKRGKFICMHECLAKKKNFVS